MGDVGKILRNLCGMNKDLLTIRYVKSEDKDLSVLMGYMENESG